MKEKQDLVEELVSEKVTGEHSDQIIMKKDIESMKNIAEKDTKGRSRKN